MDSLYEKSWASCAFTRPMASCIADRAAAWEKSVRGSFTNRSRGVTALFDGTAMPLPLLDADDSDDEGG